MTIKKNKEKLIQQVTMKEAPLNGKYYNLSERFSNT